MARGRQRDTNVVASDQLLSSLEGPSVDVTIPIDPLVDDPLLSMQDNRLYHPDPPSRPSLMQWASQLVADKSQTFLGNVLYDVSGRRYIDKPVNWTRAALAFRDPARVAICVRRKIRREVLFALTPHKRLIGRGAAKHRRRNWASAIRC